MADGNDSYKQVASHRSPLRTENSESTGEEFGIELPPAVVVARGASYLTVQGIFNIGVSSVAFAYIARALSPTGMGVMAALLLVVEVCQVIGPLGLPSALTKFLAELLGRDDLEEARNVAYAILLVNGISSAIIALSLLLASVNISEFLLKTSEYGPLFRTLALNVGFASMIPTLNSAIIGLRRFRELALINMAYFALSNSLVVALLAVGQSLHGVVVSWTIANAFNVILSVALVIKELGLPRGSLANPLPGLIKYSWPLYIGGFASFIYTWFDRMLLLAYFTLSDLGVYNAVIAVFAVLVGIPSIISTSIFPYYCELKGRDGSKSLEKAIYAASRYFAYVGLPLAVGLAATSFPAITLVAGEAYYRGGYPLAILSMFLAVAIVCSAVGGTLLVLEKTLLHTAIGTYCPAIIGLMLGILLLPVLGLNGAAVARGASLVFMMGLAVLATRRYLSVCFDMKAITKAWIATLGMAASVIMGELIVYNRLLLPVYVLVGAASYLAILRALKALTPYDIYLIEVFFGKRWKQLLRPLSSFLLSSATK